MGQNDANVHTEMESAIFLQIGGAAPANPLDVSGLTGQYVAIDGISQAGPDEAPIWNYDPRGGKNFVAVASEASAPDDFDSFQLMFRQTRGAIPRAVMGERKPFDTYQNFGDCVDMTDPLYGWTSYVRVFSDCRAVGSIEGTGKGFDSDGAVQDTVNVKARGGIFPIGSLILGSTNATNEVVDLTYGNRTGACVVGNPETNDLYALIKTTGVAAAKVRYSNDGGKTWADLAITGIGAAETVAGIAVFKNSLVVSSPVGGGATTSAIYVADIDRDTGIPAATWAKITTGFVATGIVADMYVDAGRALYLVGEKGYIYKSSDLAGGVAVSLQGSAAAANLAAVDGRGGAIAALDVTGQVLVSINAGAIWAYAATIPSAVATTIGVIDNKRVFVGTSTGLLFYSSTGGKTWAAVSFPGSGTGAINDIRVVNQNVIHLAHTVAGQGYIATTWTGGQGWTKTERRLYNLPTNDRINRIAVPNVGSVGIQANTIAAACLNADGTTGTIIVGAALVK